MRLIRSICLTALLLPGYAFGSCNSPSELNQSGLTNRSVAEEKLKAVLLEPQTMSAERRPSLKLTLESIECYLESQSSQDLELAKVKTQLMELAKNIIDAKDEAAKGSAIVELNKRINRDSGTAYVEFPTGPDTSYTLGLFDDLIDPNCNEVANSECTHSLNVATNLWWIANYMRGIPDYFNNENIIASLAFNERLNEQWLSYKDDTILLWPQEVALNSLIFKQEQKGFTEPPAYKLMALRPSLGLSYLSDQDHHFQPTLNVDLLGIYWWKYGGPKGVSAQPGRGVSLSMVWDGSDTAYGLSYHHNPKWSATIAKGDDNDVVLSMSFQLAAWFLK